jgi:hypothetical protein
MTNKDLFKQAIAEAKTIREAAITNAKEALEESLTPHLKEMLAAKLQEMENEEVEENLNNTNPEDDQDDFLKGQVGEGEDDEPMEDEEEPVEDEEGAEEEHAEEEEDEELDPNDPDFGEKLKDLIRDIVSQEVSHEEGEEELGPEGDELPADDMTGIESDEDKDIDINELLAELELEEGDESEEEDPHTLEAYDAAHDSTKKELEEAMETIQQLRGQLQEVNLLNAKLLYVNKVFKSNNLTEGQKVNVIAAFDKAETVREVKLVFETVSKNVVAKKPTAIKEHKSFASKPTGTTAAAPKKEVINEVSEQVKRMQVLAGIIQQ